MTSYTVLQVGQTSRVAATGMPIALTLIQILGCEIPSAVSQIDSGGRAVANDAAFPESSRVRLACLPLRLYAHTPLHGGGIPGFRRSGFQASAVRAPPHTLEGLANVLGNCVRARGKEMGANE